MKTKRIRWAIVALVCVIAIAFSAVYLIKGSYKYEFESITLIDDVTVSFKDVEEYVLHKKETEGRIPEKISCECTESDFRYRINLADGVSYEQYPLLDGKMCDVSLYNEVLDIRTEKGRIDYRSYLIYEDCVKAMETGADKVPIYFDIYGENGYGEYVMADGYSTDVNFAPKIAESIKLVTEAPEEIYKGAYWGGFDEAVFEITYADGKVVRTEKGGSVKGSDESVHYYDDDETGIEFTFRDASLFIPVEYKPCPVKSLEITDYEIIKPSHVKWVELTVTFDDGTEKEYRINGNDWDTDITVCGYGVVSAVEYVAEEGQEEKPFLEVRINTPEEISDRIAVTEFAEGEEMPEEEEVKYKRYFMPEPDKLIALLIAGMILLIAAIVKMFLLGGNKKYRLEGIILTDDIELFFENMRACADGQEGAPEKISIRDFSEKEYRYKVKLSDGGILDRVHISDGETAELSTVTEVHDIDAASERISVRSYILYGECVKAMEKGDLTVSLYFDVNGYNAGESYSIYEGYAVSVKFKA